jgi:hypothetical protein
VVRKVVDIYILYIELERVKLSARTSGEQSLAPKQPASLSDTSPAANVAVAAEQQKQSLQRELHNRTVVSHATTTACSPTASPEMSRKSPSAERWQRRLSSSEPLLQRRGSHSYLQLVEELDGSDSESRSGSGERETRARPSEMGSGTRWTDSSLTGPDAEAKSPSSKKKKKSSSGSKKKDKKASGEDKRKRKEESEKSVNESEKSLKPRGKGSKGSSSEKKEKKEKTKKETKTKKDKKEEKEKRKPGDIEVEQTAGSAQKRPEDLRRSSAPGRSTVNKMTPFETGGDIEQHADDARLLKALNGWRKARGQGSSDILGYCSLRPSGESKTTKEETGPSPPAVAVAGSATASVQKTAIPKQLRSGSTPSGQAPDLTADGEPMDELHRLYPNLHSALSNKLLEKWGQEQPNNTI